MKKILLVFFLFISLKIIVLSQNAVLINTTIEKEPVSKYLYGQFIEHLGKSVYGGLWSEMILDRKFFYPITDNYSPWGTGQPDSWWGGSTFPYLKASPWKIIGNAGSVLMDSINPYVGKYAAVVNLPGDNSEAGIAHEAISLIEGKTYNGYIILSGDHSSLPVTLRFATHTDTFSVAIDTISNDYLKIPFQFNSEFTSDSTWFEIVSKGSGKFNIGALSLMPEDNIDGWRADVVDLLKQLDAPIYRWPGGNFVSGYNWRDGIGERDKRPPRKNPAWTGIEPNDVGIHEFMNLMNIINSEPFLALNMGLGSVEDAVAEVEYCNGDTNTVEGKIRAANGHPAPFDVTYWAVGNEMFGSWQLGNMPIADYEIKHNEAAQGIWEVDSTTKLIAVGDVGSNWSKSMLTVCGDYMNLISEHKYCKEGTTVVSHVNAIANEIKGLVSAHRGYRSSVSGLAEKDIRIALDEYNYWYGPNPYGQLGIIYHQKDALGVAVALNEMIRNSDLFFMANYAQIVNVLGCIKTTPTASALETTALPLILYRKHFGQIPVEVTGLTSSLNGSAAFTTNKDSLTVAVVNAQNTDIYYKIRLSGSKQQAGYEMWTIANPDPNAYNEPGKEPLIRIEENKFAETIDSIKIPAYGLVIVKFPVIPYQTSINESLDNSKLLQISPNPFSNKLTINYSVNSTCRVTLIIANNTGQVVANLVNEVNEPGNYEIEWNAEELNKGIYYCRYLTDNTAITNKMILIQ